MTDSTAVVVGAGVVGAAVAYHLALRGVRVCCVERADRVGTGTTSVGFATATAYRRFPKAYFDLNRAGIADHAALAARLPHATWWHPSGTLAWSDDESFTGYLDLLADWGCPVTRRTGERSGVVALLPDEGWIDAVPFTERLLAEAVTHGATVRLRTAVEAVSLVGGRIGSVVLSDGTRLGADVLVNAAGSAADDIATMAGARPFLGQPRRSLMVRLLVGGEPLRHIVRAPDVSIRPDGPGAVVMRSDRVDATLPDRTGTPDPELVRDLLDRARRAVPALGTGTVAGAEIVAARCPSDELPSIGPLSAVPGYYEAVASAGVTLAPVFGRLIADHVVEHTVDGLITPFAPDRFTENDQLADSLAVSGR